MNNLIEDLTGEIIGFFVAGFVAIIFIIVLATLGEATGQVEIKTIAIGAIILAFAIGIPLGVISIIKFLQRGFI